jgi:hypothetical protein
MIDEVDGEGVFGKTAGSALCAAVHGLREPPPDL